MFIIWKLTWNFRFYIHSNIYLWSSLRSKPSWSNGKINLPRKWMRMNENICMMLMLLLFFLFVRTNNSKDKNNNVVHFISIMSMVQTNWFYFAPNATVKIFRYQQYMEKWHAFDWIKMYSSCFLFFFWPVDRIHFLRWLYSNHNNTGERKKN